MNNPLGITNRDKLLELLAKREQGDAIPDEATLRDVILSRVRGQDHVVDDLVRLLRVQKAKIRRDRPVANVLFLGSTGTGKSEMARSIAAAMYGDESRTIEFACAELTAEQGKTRLIGASRGYVGAEQGGELTRKMLNNASQVVVFDEIEKASSDVFDLFLAMMGEGRLTEQSTGRVADFTKAVIVLTSNLEHEAIGRIHEQINDPYERIDAIKKHLRDLKTFRPEILGRFDRIYFFKPLPLEVVAEIAALKTIKVAQQYGLTLDFIDPHLLFDALQASQKVAEFGIRELVRIVENMFGEGLLAARQQGAVHIEIHRDEAGEIEVRPVFPQDDEETTAVEAGAGGSASQRQSMRRKGRHPLEMTN